MEIKVGDLVMYRYGHRSKWEGPGKITQEVIFNHEPHWKIHELYYDRDINWTLFPAIRIKPIPDGWS